MSNNTPSIFDFKATIESILNNLFNNSKAAGTTATGEWDGIRFIVSHQEHEPRFVKSYQDTGRNGPRQAVLREADPLKPRPPKICEVLTEDGKILVNLACPFIAGTEGGEVIEKILALRAWDTIFKLREYNQPTMVDSSLNMVVLGYGDAHRAQKSLLCFVEPKLKEEGISLGFFKGFIDLLQEYAPPQEGKVYPPRLLRQGYELPYQDGKGKFKFALRPGFLHPLENFKLRFDEFSVNADFDPDSLVILYTNHEMENESPDYHQKLFMGLVKEIKVTKKAFQLHDSFKK